MKSREKRGKIFITIGLFLITVALLLTAFNLYDGYRAGRCANDILNILIDQIEEANVISSEGSNNLPPDYVINPDMEMPMLKIDGKYYIGILEIPSLELTLPVISEWNYSNLKIAPCRYSGSSYKGNFTIAAHNYFSHFGKIKNLQIGEQITFIDVRKREFSYEVRAVEILEPTAVKDMVNDSWDMTLFTCNTSGQARVAVRCLKTKV